MEFFGGGSDEAGRAHPHTALGKGAAAGVVVLGPVLRTLRNDSSCVLAWSGVQVPSFHSSDMVVDRPFIKSEIASDTASTFTPTKSCAKRL